MSMYEQSEKLTLMRESERMNRKEMSQLLDIPYSSLANYEAGRMKMSFEAGSKIFKHPRFRKYRDWFMFDEVNPEAGQVAPALAHFGQDSTTSPQSGQKSG